MKPSSRFISIVLLVGVLVAIGWIMNRTSTPGGSSGCGVGATCPTTTEDSGSPALPAEKGQGDVAAEVTKMPSTGLPRLVDVGSTTCVPCKMMTPVLEDLSTTYKGKLAVEFINISQNPRAAEEYGIRVIPTQVFYDKKGREIFRHVGFYPKDDILAKFKELGVDLGKRSRHD
jgi:thioredoxin 1